MSISPADTAPLLRQALSHLDGIELTPTHIRLLSFLSFQDYSVGYKSIELRTGISSTLLRMGLARLVQLELVDKPDKRYARYSITIQGRATLQRISKLLIKHAKKMSAPCVPITPRRVAS